MFGAWGRFVYRFRWPVLLASLALVAGSVFAIIALSTKLSSGSSSDKRLEAAQAYALINDELPAQGTGFTLIFTAHDPNLTATDPAFAGAVDAALAPLRDDPRVAKIN